MAMCALGTVTRHDLTQPDPFARAPTYDTSRLARMKFWVSMGAQPAQTKFWGFRGCTTPMKAGGSIRKTGHTNV